MANYTYSAEDYQRAIQGLMPRGAVWPRDSDAVQSKVFAGLTQVYARNTARALALLIDGLPATTLELLPEWELTLGLPSACAGPNPTLQGRRNQVVARFTDSGGQSVAHFIELAKNLGYDVTIDQFCPNRMGRSFGRPFGGVDWAHTWQVNAPEFTRQGFRFGGAKFGEPFSSWGNTVLLCELRAISPAHTILNFSYSE